MRLARFLDLCPGLGPVGPWDPAAGRVLFQGCSSLAVTGGPETLPLCFDLDHRAGLADQDELVLQTTLWRDAEGRLVVAARTNRADEPIRRAVDNARAGMPRVCPPPASDPAAPATLQLDLPGPLLWRFWTTTHSSPEEAIHYLRSVADDLERVLSMRPGPPPNPGALDGTPPVGTALLRRSAAQAAERAWTTAFASAAMALSGERIWSPPDKVEQFCADLESARAQSARLLASRESLDEAVATALEEPVDGERLCNAEGIRAMERAAEARREARRSVLLWEVYSG